jgi:plasmid stabilization system protein ParE
VRVIWSPAALNDIGRPYDYFAGFNPRAAAGLAEELRTAGNTLQYFPERGRAISGGRRELSVIWPYVIRYRLTAEGVQILRVRHDARRPLA